MPINRVEMYKGRNRDQKRALARAMTEAFNSTCGGTPESVQVVIVDVDKEDWAVAGVLAADRT